MKQSPPIQAPAAWQLWDGGISRADALVLLAVFGALMGWSIWQGMAKKADALGTEMERELGARPCAGQSSGSCSAWAC
jgi:cation:H+ antiporter